MKSNPLLHLLSRFFKEEEGATMVEYGLMLALIALVAVGAVTLVGIASEGLFTKNGNALVNAFGGGP